MHVKQANTQYTTMPLECYFYRHNVLSIWILLIMDMYKFRKSFQTLVDLSGMSLDNDLELDFSFIDLTRIFFIYLDLYWTFQIEKCH